MMLLLLLLLLLLLPLPLPPPLPPLYSRRHRRGITGATTED